VASRAPICTHVGHLSSAAPKRIVALAYAIGAIEDRADKGNLRVPVMISIRSFFIHCCFSWSVRGEEHGWWRPLCAQWRNACMRAGTSARGPTSTAAASAVSPSVMCLASSKYDHRSSRDAVDPTRAHSDVQGAVVHAVAGVGSIGRCRMSPTPTQPLAHPLRRSHDASFAIAQDQLGIAPDLPHIHMLLHT
jgi:hypothetical protein